MPDNKEEVIPIDPDGRYIIIAKGATAKSSLELSKMLKSWWEGNEKFFILTVREDIKVTLERLDA